MWVRLTLYVVIVILSTLQTELGKITTDVLASFTWLDYTKLVIAVLIPPLVTVRAFIDQSLTKVIEETKTENETEKPGA